VSSKAGAIQDYGHGSVQYATKMSLIERRLIEV